MVLQIDCSYVGLYINTWIFCRDFKLILFFSVISREDLVQTFSATAVLVNLCFVLFISEMCMSSTFTFLCCDEYFCFQAKKYIYAAMIHTKTILRSYIFCYFFFFPLWNLYLLLDQVERSLYIILAVNALLSRNFLI